MSDADATQPHASPGGFPAFEHAVRDWCDRYVTRIDRDMTMSFPLLEKNLLAALDRNLFTVLKGNAVAFSKTVIEPEVTEWLYRIATPIREDAGREMAAIELKHEALLDDNFDLSYLTLFSFPAAAGLGGLAVVIGGLMLAISTTTWWFFFAATTVAWPIVVAAATVGGVLVAVGAANVATTRTKVAALFSKAFIPKLRECLIGSGYTAEGKQHPSVRRQFQEAVEKTAEAMLAAQKRGQPL
jgi:hypothetical protein